MRFYVNGATLVHAAVIVIAKGKPVTLEPLHRMPNLSDQITPGFEYPISHSFQKGSE